MLQGLLLQGPSTAPKSSLSIQTQLLFAARGITVRIQKMLGKAVALGSSWLILPFMAQTFQKSTFVEKNIFNSTVCNHLIKVIRSESPRNNVQRCVTAELAAALSGQPRPVWDT